jgi:hypothetical protein
VEQVNVTLDQDAAQRLCDKLVEMAIWDKVGPAYYLIQRALDDLAPKEPQIVWDEKFPIMTKARKRQGYVYPAEPTGAYAEIGKREDGKRCIRLTGIVWNKPVDRVFVEGETAEWGSYNLSYMGEILAITPKQVKIAKYKRDGQVKCLDLSEFAWRNHKLDVEKNIRDNHETMMYI